MLHRIARSSLHHRRLVVALWVLALVAAVFVGPVLAGRYANSGRLPHTDSQAAYDSLARDFPRQHGDEARIVFADIRRDRPAIDAYLSRVARIEGVISVESPVVSPGGHVAIVPVTTANGDSDHPARTADRIQALARPLRDRGVDVQFSGVWFAKASMPASEVIGVIAAVVVLLLAFGSVIAMGLPIVSALIGVAVSLAGVGVMANVLTTPSFVPQVAAMVGIGVGIDYALFIVTRYRSALHRTGSPEAAVLEAMATSGRAVVFAGFTVMISVLGILLIGVSFLQGLAVGTSIAAAVAVLAAVTLLPALLGFVGFTIDRLNVGRATSNKESRWHRWARFVQRRPTAVALVGLTVLIVAAVPALGLRLGSADASNDPVSSTTHRAYDLIAKGFGPGANGPILVVADTTAPGSAAALPRLVAALRDAPDVLSVSQMRRNPNGTAALATLTPRLAPQDEATKALLLDLRHHVVPDAVADSGLQVHLGGTIASSVDFTDVMADRLAIFIGGVLVLSFLLLMVVFRSILVPLKAVLMNLLSIGAAYGVVVAIFQWGWGAGILGVGKAPIEPWVPMLMFAIVFGLSMDYEVFLLSAVREHYDRTHVNAESVAEGLASTARVITAAALIMVFVFGSFVLSDVHALKLIGFGLAVAVALDASVVRVVLVPATMELLGDANWWFPRWLARVVPRVHVEAETTGETKTPRETELVGADR